MAQLEERANQGPPVRQGLVSEGISQEQAEQQVSDQDAEGAVRRTQQLGEAAPQAVEALEPDRLNTLADMVTGAINALSGGQFELPPIAEVTEPQEQIPADIFAPLTAIQGFLEAEGLQTDIDLEAMATSNDGIGELAASISQLGEDEAVRKAINKPIKVSTSVEVPSKEAPENEEDNSGVDRFLKRKE